MYFSTQFVVFSLFFLLFSRILYKHCFLAEGRAEPFPFINILWAWADTSKQYSCMNKHTQKCEKKVDEIDFMCAPCKYECIVIILIFANDNVYKSQFIIRLFIREISVFALTFISDLQKISSISSIFFNKVDIFIAAWINFLKKFEMEKIRT